VASGAVIGDAGGAFPILDVVIAVVTAKAARIVVVAGIVRMYSEHSVQVIVTEHGIADLRGRSPHERAEMIIEHCAHPEFRTELHGYLRLVRGGHTPHTLRAAFAFHCRFLDTGNMHGVDWEL
jgi:acyl-CoA hydrolase